MNRLQTKTLQASTIAALVATLITLPASPAGATITWTGAVNNDFWTVGNWAGGAPVFGGTTSDSIFISGATGTITNSAFSQLTLADGFSISITGSTLDFLTGGGGAQGIQGVAGGSANVLTLNNSTVSAAFVGVGINAGLTFNSSIRLSGANRAINSSVEASSVSLGIGSSITYTAGNTDGGLSQPQSIFNTATGLDYKTDTLTGPLTDFVLTGSDSTPFSVAGGGDGINQGAFTITAVPEPSAFALAGLGLAGLLIFRRRK
jgi:PEP-CTERM motif